jgi:GTPase SAR1 family protein
MHIPSVAIVGYTNAGKSSLLNRLTGAGVLVEDALFATLDPTTGARPRPTGARLVLTDTVGFVRHLPHQLVEAFPLHPWRRSPTPTCCCMWSTAPTPTRRGRSRPYVKSSLRSAPTKVPETHRDQQGRRR